MGRPLAHVPDPAGDGHASYARHFAELFMDTFAGLGIHPDRYYWMSEIYASGEMDRYIRAGARPRRGGARRSTSAWPTSDIPTSGTRCR